MPGIKGTMEEFKKGTLHSGSKKGPKVTSRKQAIAIGLSEERKAGKKIPYPKAHGSGPFSESEKKQGYKVMYSAKELDSMDVDRLAHNKDYVLAQRRDGTTGSNRARKNLRRSEGKE